MILTQRCRSVVAALAVVSILVATFAGCGGSDSSSEPASTPSTGSSSGLTKEEWIAQADAICEEADAEFEPFEERAEELEDGPETPKAIIEIAELLRESAPVAEAQIDNLHDLDPPSGDEELIDDLLSAVERRQEIAEEAATLFEDGKYSELEELNDEADQVKQEAKGIAKGYGLKECGSEDG